MEWHWWILGITSSIIATVIGAALTGMVGWIGSAIKGYLARISDQIDSLQKGQVEQGSQMQKLTGKVEHIETKLNSIDERTQRLERESRVQTHKESAA